ncbi:MAG TPA: 30S ribosomal protein S16 [Thermoanaerobaculia bacterium]|jgi:small subunit ribosomal protein S16
MLRIRLRRVGGTNAPAYRIVVSDGRRTPTAKVIEELGYYDPTKNPPLLKVDLEKAAQWIGKGAVASDTVRKILKPAKA